MNYGSVCSGIEAASAAWAPFGWHASFLSEIEAFPRAVLSHHFPEVPLHGDFTTFGADDYGPIDLLVGGTPCQSFSVAGLRGGLADKRGNLALEYLRLADRKKPRWVLWENVPGVLSSGGGRDFGSFLGGLGELGYGFSYRVLDAQYFGLAQRRKRVFVVGYLGDWRRAAAVLFEPASLRWDSAPRRETGKGVAGTIGARTGNSVGAQDASAGHMIARCLNAHPNGSDGESETFVVANTVRTREGHGCERRDGQDNLVVAHSLRAIGFDASEDGTERGTPLVPVGSWQQNSMGGRGTLGYDADTSVLRPVKPQSDHQMLQIGSAVRRLTPRECARLQGFPDDYLDIQYRGKPAADGPKYRALGNSMAVPCMAWIGRRIAAQELAA